MKIHSNERTYYECSECQQKFMSKQGLKYHQKSHNSDESLKKPFKCLICEKRFGQQSTLIRHYRIHTGERPYQCRICSQTFNTSSNRLVHMKTVHSDERNYHCQQCQKSFNLKSHLLSHIQNIHCPSELRKRFTCTKCSKSFLSKHNFKQHQLSHSNGGQGYFVCGICNIDYKCKISLLKHIKMNHKMSGNK